MAKNWIREFAVIFFPFICTAILAIHYSLFILFGDWIHAKTKYANSRLYKQLVVYINLHQKFRVNRKANLFVAIYRCPLRAHNKNSEKYCRIYFYYLFLSVPSRLPWNFGYLTVFQIFMIRSTSRHAYIIFTEIQNVHKNIKFHTQANQFDATK